MTRVIHTGDTHIGYQQYNSPDRRRDFLDAFRDVAEDAVEDEVDAVVHAGDLFHDRRPGLVDLQGTIEVLRTLEDAGVPFLAIVGNHETKRDAQWLDLFADLGLATRLGREPVVVDDVAVYGLDFVPVSRRDALEYAFAEPPDATDHAVLVAHGLFEPFPHANWDTETVLEESTVDFDAVLLGDNHAADTAEVGDAWVTYCGSTERASASERDARGYNLVEFDEDVAISRRSIASTRDFAFVDLDLDDGEGIDRVRERVGEYELEDAVVIVTVEGDGEPFPPATVEEFAADRGALVARVNDRREIQDDRDVSIQFADPDAAVRERIRDLGLSDAARDIDGTVRDTADVAASNVRETVERRVREVLEDDPSALEPADDGSPGETPIGSDDPDGEPSDAEGGEPESAAAADRTGGPEPAPTTDDDDSSESARTTEHGEPREPAAAETDDEPVAAETDDEPVAAETDDEPAATDTDDEPA
ncbi:DNA double-strand break repair protein Mre11, partial [Halovivax sp.]|uniref:DNA double-strand break repair protein Mre11 n=1 Tax=Halovivax sp. TaxID=1935978 RepID=UPI0025C52FBC